MAKKEFSDLKKEIRLVQNRWPALSLDNSFVLWFVNAFLIDEEATASSAIVGGAGDIGIDALWIDKDACKVYLVQAKYHVNAAPPLTPARDVIDLAELGKALTGAKKHFDARLARANATVKPRLEEARSALLHKSYRLSLLFATTGRAASDLEDCCLNIGDDAFEFELFDRAALLRMLSDYEEGVAPPTPTVTLAVDSDTILARVDESRDITSWIFALNGGVVSKLVKENGARLFARNIRGYLGASAINREIQTTLTSNPQDFWYFNNGLTIVCDDAQMIKSGDQLKMKLVSPQIINGQQTAYALSKHGKTTASVLARAIAIQRDAKDSTSYDRMVSQIVQATNWQNAILPSDLVSNDGQQVRIEREFRKRYYAYVRKRQSKGEVRRHIRYAWKALITKQELAQALGACFLDPYVVRSGKERLFEQDTYTKLFSSRPANEYLCLYWLGRAARERGRQTKIRPYAKWVVLNRMHDEIRPLISSSAGRERFLRTLERVNWYHRPLKPLMDVFDCLYKAADKFYSANKYIGGQLYDHSLFYKREGLHRSFAEYWRHGNHGQRKKLAIHLRKLNSGLVEYEDSLAE